MNSQQLLLYAQELLKVRPLKNSNMAQGSWSFMSYVSNYCSYGCCKITSFFLWGLATCRLPLLQWVSPIPMYICAAPVVLHLFKKIKGKKDMNLGLNVLGFGGDAKRKSEGGNECDCDQVMLYTCVKFSMNKLSKNCVRKITKFKNAILRLYW